MVKYIKCPRCELNYIDSEKQEYCDVCIAEMKGKKLQFADLDEEDFEELDAELDSDELCPVCGVNRIRPGEKMCESCKQQQEYEDDDVDMENDEEWKNYLEEDDGDLTVDEDLQEEIEEEFADDGEDEEYNDEPDDFYESEDVDSLSDLEDDEYDDEDEDDEDYDDEDDEDDDF